MKLILSLRILSAVLAMNMAVFVYASDSKPSASLNNNVGTNLSNRYDARIAIVDIQTVLSESIAVQGMQREITQIGANLEKLMQEKERELKSDEDAIVKKRGTVGDSEFEKNVSQFHEKLTSVQRMMQEKKSRLDKAHADAMAKVQDVTIGIIEDVAKEQNLNVVMSASPLLYYNQSYDITKIVISRLNNKLKKVPFNY